MKFGWMKFWVLLLPGVIALQNISASIIDKSNLNPKIENAAQKYLQNEDFCYSDSHVWPDYLAGVSRAVWAILALSGNYVDSADLESVTYHQCVCC
jgi:hypothetical protein